jgi:hypothetical protein
MKEAFKEHEFRQASLDVIELVNQILEKYVDEGYILTVRQAFYQLLARGRVLNCYKSYRRIERLLKEGRLAGLIDWDHIEDRARETITPATWNNPAEIVRAVAEQYRVDHWRDQPTHVEVLVEKQALEGVLLPVTTRWGVPFTADKGFLSESIVYEIAQRLQDAAAEGKAIHLLYFGDHDPSGLDMDRDLKKRLEILTRGAVDIKITRLALTMEQIEHYKPPENLTKKTDTRSKAYIARHGGGSWELDALEPHVLVELLEDAIRAEIDPGPWDAAEAREVEGRRQLSAFAAKVEAGGRKSKGR